ncbi:WD40 repeat-like protein [Mycena indigotica]|uniref:WD40 repeat-like protein n=1 Tax=Mycena indigotica TaxID=2126181 RepID=A0A8H6TGC1_9AGAR|nr:WD40 repeat-like protein [Mycena indigotica]KAF7316237.1 WD40 repeat-like protein [Mycena indigotica]
MNHHELDENINLLVDLQSLRWREPSLYSSLYRPHRQRRHHIDTLIATGFPYSIKLDKHLSCVNTLAFSSSNGRFLASGGDDLDIHIWDLYEDHLRAPCHTLTGHYKNIFQLKFSAHDRYLYSGGVDNMVLQYDVSTMGLRGKISSLAHQVFREHDDNIRGIATHCVQDDVFLTAGEDGRIIQHDQRATPASRARAQDTLQLQAEVTSVEFHPTMDHIFVTSDTGGAVCLRDRRMAFGPGIQRTNQGIVQTYTTRLSRRDKIFLANPEPSSVVFNRQGTQLAVTMLNYFPTIYGLHDPNPLAVCSAPNLPNGIPVSARQRTYSNRCTIKHGAFGGPGLDQDTLYIAGSDDFHAYAWSLPPGAILDAKKTVVAKDEWDMGFEGVVAFANHPAGSRCIPAQLDTPLTRLGGHSSVVNTVQIHPHMLVVATAGVESRVLLHGAVNSLFGGMEATSTSVRDPLDQWAWDGESYGSDWEADQLETIYLFDSIVLEETNASRDIFNTRKWVPPESDDLDEEELGASDSAEDLMSSD